MEQIDRRFGIARVILFFLFVIGFGFAVATGSTVWAIVSGVSFGAFLVAVIWNETVRDRITALRNESQTLLRLLARLDRDWEKLAADRLGKQIDLLKLTEPQRSLSDDLDLVGRTSLFQLVNMAGTQPGMQTVANWLCDPVTAEVAQQRHEAVEFLAPDRERRIRFYTLSRDVGSGTGNPEKFVQWAAEPNWLPARRWLVPWGNVTAIVSAILLIGMVFGFPGQSHEESIRLGGFGLVAVAVVNLSLASIFMGPVAEIFSIAMASRRQVREYAELFEAASWLPTGRHAPMQSIALTLLGTSPSPGAAESIKPPETERSAAGGMRQLAAIARKGALKQSAATFLIYLPLQAFGLWDVRVLRRLEAWKDRHGPQVAGWFAALGQLEVLLSLAALRDEYPDWASPRWADDGDPDETRTRIEMHGLGHPLIPDDGRVVNDVSVGPRGTLLLVTGSNMSGKSTMLRSVGLNVSLAMAGGPVCCRQMKLPAVELATSIRVSDDLSQGVSFYMAELNRLAKVVEHARSVERGETAAEESGRGARLVLFLLDEILQGTNSRERQIAVTRVLRHLVGSGAIGAITTHDLELADEPELQRIAHTVHFRETIQPDASGNDRMTFDYRMRDGVSPTTNALRLLEMVGLGEQDSA